MFYPLRFKHPHAWHSSLPAKWWDRDSSSWRFPPRTLPAFAREYRSYIVSELDKHGLRLLNRGVSRRALAIELEADALVAGRLAGVKFTKGPSKPRHVVAGDLSAEWLAAVSRNAARWAVKHHDPSVANAQRRHDSAVRGGQKSKRPRAFSAADLPAGSIKAQAEALGCSRATVCRLRRELAGVAA